MSSTLPWRAEGHHPGDHRVDPGRHHPGGDHSGRHDPGTPDTKISQAPHL
ncbi:hypothetical protein [Mycolicibacterium insubricum]|nr:hypothetical protein [Mycolicibacterium insubricum]MCV7081501.1 hypothetical protein [Mycolicibacterium insubricum]